MVYGDQREWETESLFLNMLLVGLSDEFPLPSNLELSDEEIKLVQDLITNIKIMWDKMRNTSEKGLRQTFFQRKGSIQCDEKYHRWIVEIEGKPYDVLLDSLPWSYRIMKMPWMEYIMEVKWR